MKKLSWPVIITLFIIAFVIVAGLIVLTKYSGDTKQRDLAEISSNPFYTKGMITKMSLYKGHSINVKYNVGNTRYEYEGGLDSNPNKLNVGDSINLKYSIKNPEIAITELENGY